MGFSPQRLLDVVRGMPRSKRLWVAYSGGLDSTVLLHALVQVRDRLPPIHALHVDHGLHGDSAAWASHCRGQCDALAVPLAIRRLALQIAKGASLEAEARAARRSAFAAVVRAGDLLVTAQHRNDQAETLLLQLLRGSGLSGLAAMPALSPLGDGLLGRPLLDFTREELVGYARLRDLHWVEDPSNADIGFDRNFLRREILPSLARRWPAYAATFSRSARHCAEAQGLIDDLAADEMVRVRGARPDTLSISALRAREAPLCRALLRGWIRQAGFPVPDNRRLERILGEILPARPDANPVIAWAETEVRCYRDELFVIRALPPKPSAEVPIAWSAGAILELPAGLGRLRDLRARDAAIPGGRSVRFAQTAEGFRIDPRCERKSLKNHFQELGVPAWLRPFLPQVYEQGELVWVAGIGARAPESGRPNDSEVGAAIVWEDSELCGYLPSGAR